MILLDTHALVWWASGAAELSAKAWRAMGSFDDGMPGDPADRMIVATAMQLQARLVTADDRLRRVRQVETIW